MVQDIAQKVLRLPPFPFNNNRLLEGLVFYAPLWHERAHLNGAMKSPFLTPDRFHHSATVTGTTLTRLTSGVDAPSFDGDDSISLTNNSIFNFISEDFSILMWIKPSVITDTDYELFNRGVVAAEGYRFFHRNGGTQFWTLNGASQQTLSSLGMVVDTWYLVGVSRSGGSVILYRNGVNTNSTSGNHSNPTSNTRTAYIGVYTDGSSAHYSGIIGEVWVYKDKSLTAVEHQQIYRTTKGRYG